MKHKRDSSAAVVLIGILFLLVVLAIASSANAETVTEIEKIIIDSSKRHGIDPKLALAIAEVESGMNPNAVGSLGEIGLFQLRPEYHEVSLGQTKTNVDTAMKYLVQIRRSCDHYADAYFVCWNLGPNYKRLKHPKLFRYYKKVVAAMKRRSKADSNVYARSN